MAELALHGGEPFFSAAPPQWPLPDPAVHDALNRVFASGEWGRYESETYHQAERALAAAVDTGHVLLCSSGTIAVEIALRALLVGAGDEVVMAGYDFGANFRAVEATGARPVLVDVLPGNRTLNPLLLEAAASSAVKAVLVSHLHGGMANMQRICELAAHFGWLVVEDACQVHGATVQGKPAGAWGDVGVTSFGGSKLVTAGRGGAVFTSSPQIFQRAKITNDRGNQAYPLSALQAAVIQPQLLQLPGRQQQRAAAVASMTAALAGVACLEPVDNAGLDCDPAYYKHAWRYDAARCGGVPRETFCAAVRAEGVAVDAGFRGFGSRSSRRCRRPSELPHSTAAADTTVVLHHPILLQDLATIQKAAGAIIKVYNAFNS